ncbi:MAG TPA: SPW repeat protein [Devosia sp.]|jgi:hypothetical protein|uniref:SPW repeat domain-containing protein n=1 Tax=Devosia sp. TaxID=1871048 RepID=UPI002F923FB9
MINTRTHGIIDYVMGLALIVVPFLFNFGAQSEAALWVPVVLGVVILMTSLLTKYELSIAKIIPMPVHIGADVLVGLLLAVSPWLFGFAEQMWMPHVVLGALEIGVALTTQKHSAYDGHASVGSAAHR